MADDSNASPRQALDIRPVPDPTILTTEQLTREIGRLREILEARLDGMDKATRLEYDSVLRRLGEIVQERGVDIQAVREYHITDIKGLRELTNEKFSGTRSTLEDIERRMLQRDTEVTTRFQERDTRSEREARDNKIAVDAAFAAAKEAVAEQNKSNALAIAKSEAATTKQLDQLVVLLQTTAKASDDKIDDLKTQIADLRSVDSVRTGRGAGLQQGWGILVAVVGIVGVLISAAILIGHAIP